MMMLRRLAVVITALCVGAGCSSNIGQYPVRWPSLPAPSPPTCDSIVGTYTDAGEMHYGDVSLASSLSELLLQDRDRREPSAVRLSFTAGDLQMTAYDANGERLSRVFETRKDGFTCKDGVAVLWVGGAWSGDGSSGVPLMGRESVRLELHRTGDSLIVKEERRQFILILFMPAKDRTVKWHRFRRDSRTAFGAIPRSAN